MSYPLKHIRLEQLHEAGFNTANFVCFPPKQLDPIKLKKFFDRFRKKHGISLRHFHQNETQFFKCPVKYEVTDWRAALRFSQEHNKMFYTLCNEAIPLREAIYGGNIWVLGGVDYAVEYFAGPGSPRDTESKKLEYFRRTFGEKMPEGVPIEIQQLATKATCFLPEERPIIIEFNIYPYPIGRRREASITWEWRQG